jgi:hypothetical protein
MSSWASDVTTQQVQPRVNNSESPADLANSVNSMSLTNSANPPESVNPAILADPWELANPAELSNSASQADLADSANQQVWQVQKINTI